MFNIFNKRKNNNNRKILIDLDIKEDIEGLFAENVKLRSCLDKTTESKLTFDEILYKLVENEDKISHLKVDYSR